MRERERDEVREREGWREGEARGRYRMSCDGGYGAELFARDENDAASFS
jgi:hypothetical protein